MFFSLFCAGFYDTSVESADLVDPNFHRIQNKDVLGERRDTEEWKQRRKDKEKQKRRKENDLPTAVMQINK